MSTETIDGSLMFVCDDCDREESDMHDLEFSEFWGMLKSQGWRCTKEGSTWVHFCPDCVRDWSKSQRAR